VNEITGVVLCGGRARRMGGADKPLLKLGTRSVLERIVARLAPQLRCIVLSCKVPADGYARFGLPIVADRRCDAGPLAGIEAALTACKTPLMFVWPGDAPDPPPHIVATLAGALDSADVAVLRAGGRLQHLCLLVRQHCLGDLSRWLDEGGRSVGGWLASRHVQIVPFPGDVANLNTPGDVRAWRSRYHEVQ
jgi:molybdenum cofactor guanylyltransferase